MIFGISLKYQEKELYHYCFTLCKKIIAESFYDDAIGSLFPCTEPRCKYESKKSPIIGEIHGNNVCIRKLKDLSYTNYQMEE